MFGSITGSYCNLLVKISNPVGIISNFDGARLARLDHFFWEIRNGTSATPFCICDEQLFIALIGKSKFFDRIASLVMEP